MEIIVRYFAAIALDLAKRARSNQCSKRDKNQQAGYRKTCTFNEQCLCVLRYTSRFDIKQRNRKLGYQLKDILRWQYQWVPLSLCNLSLLSEGNLVHHVPPVYNDYNNAKINWQIKWLVLVHYNIKDKPQLTWELCSPMISILPPKKEKQIREVK
jgi:hypothetical protein